MAQAQSTTSFLVRTALLTFAGGLRSQVPFATLAAAAARGEFAKQTSGLVGLLRRRDVQLLCGAGAVGELVIDKLPITPSRLEPAGFAGRLMFGGIAGAIFARGNNCAPALGFAIGVAASGVGTYAGYHARSSIGHETGLPDPIVAVGEDVMAIAIAHLAVSR
jgi:uncharacterized membrane protein